MGTVQKNQLIIGKIVMKFSLLCSIIFACGLASATMPSIGTAETNDAKTEQIKSAQEKQQTLLEQKKESIITKNSPNETVYFQSSSTLNLSLLWTLLLVELLGAAWFIHHEANV